jgi:hypothetical protein
MLEAWFGRKSEPASQREMDNSSWPPMLWHLIAMVMTIFVAIALSRFQGAVGLSGICLLILATTLALGGSVGFLFAIPRLASQVEAATIDAMSAAGSGIEKDPMKSEKHRLLNSNNNLEKVSDWLTTMLVGVGLTQLGNIDIALASFRKFLASNAKLYPGQAGYEAGLLPVIGPMLLVVGLTMGFVYFYVFTRVMISPQFLVIENYLQKNHEGSPVVTATSDIETVKQVAEQLPIDNKATRAVATAAAPSVEDALAVMNDALYQPAGYLSAIRIADALKSTDAVNRAEYWFYLAAARGQALKEANENERAALRDAVLYAVRKTVEISPSFRSELWRISDPDGFDDDLGALRGDAEFDSIVRPNRP